MCTWLLTIRYSELNTLLCKYQLLYNGELNSGEVDDANEIDNGECGRVLVYA